ncbi:MAG: ClbS/DfsB family four-helix bundle protein [Chloroflexota bacterium]|nr:ClbS/DfsB family four-helix bundle protein [Chloroflexota bacterium]
MADSGTPTTLSALIERGERSWQNWVDAVEGVPDDRLAEPIVGYWSTKDLIGHVAFWEDWVIGECQRVLAGEPEPTEDMGPVDERLVAESKSTPAAAQKRYRDEAHARLAAYLVTIPQDTPLFAELAKPIATDTYGHYDEHAAQVRAWREAEGI